MAVTQGKFTEDEFINPYQAILEEWAASYDVASETAQKESVKEKAVKKCVSFTKEMKSHDFTYRFIAKNGKAFWLRDIVNVIVENGNSGDK